MRIRRCIAWLMGVAALGLHPGTSLEAQSVRGAVTEQLSLAPGAGAVVALLRVGEEGALETVAQALADEEGLFLIQAPAPGVYRLQAELEGGTTPLSPALELGVDEVAEVVLTLPSALLQMALSCQGEATEGTTAVVGYVLDPEAEVGLPGVTVSASWYQGARTRRVEAVTDAAGRYRLCGVAGDAGDVAFEALLLGRWSRQGGVSLSGPAVVFHDIEVRLTLNAGLPPDVLQERILLEAASRGLGDLRGRVVDQDSGRPVPYLVVRTGQAGYQAITDEDGRFVLEGVPPGTYVLELRSIGYRVRTEAVEVPAGKNVLLQLRLAPQAVELEGLEVTARTSAEAVERVTPFRRDIVYGEVMAVEEQRGARAFEALRRASPGLRVTEVWREVGPPTLCVQTNRRIQSIEVRQFYDKDRPDLMPEGMRGIPCDNVQVVVDGKKIPDGPEFLLRTPASEIESLEFVTPVQAQILYGTGGNTSNGVVVVYTRGNGPYASPLRNPRIR